MNDEYLAQIVHINNLQMELAIQIISNDKTVRSNTVQDLKDFKSQSLKAQAKKGTNKYPRCLLIKKQSI